MITQYPHFLFVKVTAEAVQDENGNWTEASEQWMFNTVCRQQANGKGSSINTIDGQTIVFSSTIHMPLTAIRVNEGMEVLVTESDSVSGVIRARGKVLKFDAGQLHCRLWV